MFKQLTFYEYQALDRLNQSTIKEILANPFKWALGASRQVKSEAMDFGSLCHDLILSPSEIENKYKFSKFDKLDFRLKECKAEKAEAENEGKILLDKATRDKAEQLVEHNLSSLDVWLDDGEQEVTFLGEIDGVECKARLDWINKYHNRIIDIKIMQNADKESFTKSVLNFGYHIQASFYMTLTGAKTFQFLVIEKEYPFMMGVYELDNMALQLGESEWRKALEIYKNKEQFATNQYFDYNDPTAKNELIQQISLPTWAYYKSGLDV